MIFRSNEPKHSLSFTPYLAYCLLRRLIKRSSSYDLKPSALPDADALAEQALAARPALKAAQTRIVQREQALRAEKARRWPWFELSGRYRSTASTTYPNEGLVGIEFPLPVLNLNGGPIRVATAELDVGTSARPSTVSNAETDGLHSVCRACNPSQYFGALSARSPANPAEHEQLMELALKGGRFDLVALLSSEESALRGQREYSDARLAYRRAWLALEAAVGNTLKEVIK